MTENRIKENLNLRSEEVQEILSKPPTWIVRWGITIIFILTCMLLILAFLISYPDFVSAKVLVTTKQPTEHIIARYSGALSQIYIENGDTVESGQDLAVIRNTANIQDVYKLKRILDTIQFHSNEFIFPIDSSSQLILGDIESAYIGFEKSYMNYRLFNELEPYSSQLISNRNSFKEVKKRLFEQIKQKGLVEQEFQLKKIYFERYKRLFDKGIIAQEEFENKKLEYIQMQKNINAMAISISQMREAISSAYQTSENTQISKQEYTSQLLTNLSSSYNSLKKAVKEWEHQYLLSSSINGTISFQEFWGVNQFVNSGEIVFSILPKDTSNLIGKLTISSQNSGKVNIGQKVLVKLDNFPYQQYGVLIGLVKSVSISPDNEGNYFVYISLPNGAITSYNKKLPFDQELIGNAEIITEDLTIAERIFYKFKSLFS